MVTDDNRTQKLNGELVLQRTFYGLSTDSKPTTGVGNGSCFIEMNTGKCFFFNAEDSEWVEVQSSGGGGGSGSSDDIVIKVMMDGQFYGGSVDSFEVTSGSVEALVGKVANGEFVTGKVFIFGTGDASQIAIGYLNIVDCDPENRSIKFYIGYNELLSFETLVFTYDDSYELALY